MDRRKFLTSMVGGSVALAIPGIAIAEASVVETSVSASVIPNGVSDEVRSALDTIHQVEAQMRQMRGFSYWAHNELRHYYLAVSERTSRIHSDILLQHSIMDSYVLNTLSDWHLTPNEGDQNYRKAIKVLLENAERDADLVHLRAACMITAADTHRRLLESANANLLYNRVLLMGGQATLHPYKQLANQRLGSPMYYR